MKSTITKPLLYLFAITAGSSVGNLFSCQPILPLLQDAFHVSARQIGWVPTATQIGYALGILFIVPLGDMVSRRKLLLVMMSLMTLASLALALAPTYPALLVASAVLGAVSIATQILTPLTAQLSDEASRGRHMGIIISGMLLGVLLSRTIAGYLAGAFGWTSVYFFAAGLSAILTVALAATVPNTDIQYKGTYAALMRSLYDLVKRHATLRESMLFGALFFAAFNAFWATLDFLLLEPPFRYGAREAGLFGLIGAAGAFVAPVAGRVADKRDPRVTIGLGAAVSALAFGAMWLGQSVLWVLIIGTALMDMGIQAGHVTNQTRIYALDPASRSRFATIYVFSYFVGGAVGSATGSWAFAAWNWKGPCLFGLAVSVAVLAVYALGTAKDAAPLERLGRSIK
jgi:predicted MFS family arabinose efflux permease